jgi:hypothetical protein
VFCGILAIIGYSIQWIASGVLGSLLNPFLIVPIAVALTLPVTRVVGSKIAAILPKDETNAVSVESLVGLGGVVTAGPISSTQFGMARFTDKWGTDHQLLVCGEDDTNIAQNDQVVLLHPHREREIAFVVRKLAANQ